ncbi:hypothetical protein LTR36_006261 [Oleoguttula mirabilis]|uniref:Uncharacterized protein n=1 Tax=Oleoguttula mirabilis TaxID=1507867 RepID=A0AAV9JCY0_9PEZI|nr:hypothetical protein LTR36_006261 [Oleoguttula mirabilis]
MASLLSSFNRLLPFATPGTPIVQDLLHLAAICGLLYYAPQIQEWMQQRRTGGLEPDRGAPQEDELAANGGDEALEHQHNIVRDAEPDTIDADEQQGPAANLNGQLPQPLPDHVNDAAQAGPAQAVNIPTQRNVGAKKLKSIARRDQHRAYHEFQRSQGEAQRALDAEGASEREASLAAERERRRVAEAAFEAKKAEERKQKREQERRQREDEISRRELVISIVRRELEQSRMCDLFTVANQVGGDVDEEWVEKILGASGMLGRKGSVITMITSTGWAVRVSAEDMAKLYHSVMERDGGDEDGAVSHELLGKTLENCLKGQAGAAP